MAPHYFFSPPPPPPPLTMIAQCLMQKAVLDYIRVHTHHRVVPRRVTNRRPRSNIIEITWQEVQLRINDNKEKEKYMHVLTIKKTCQIIFTG